MTSPASSSPIELYRRGVSVLQEQLGSVDSIRFLHLFDQGEGDYTTERQQNADGRPLDEVCEEIRNFAVSENS